jgi:hypothetical protein
MKKLGYWIIGVFCIFCMFNCKKADKLVSPPIRDMTIDFPFEETEYSEEDFLKGNFPFVTVWGWSKNGKVAVSQVYDGGVSGLGGTGAFIFNTVNDTVLWEKGIDYKDTNSINNFQRICKQYAIEINKQDIIKSGYSMISVRSNDDNIYRYYINIDVVPRHSGPSFNTPFWDTL